MKMHIGLAGYARSGKDTFAARLTERHGFHRVAFADPVREAILRLNPLVDTGTAFGPARVADLIDMGGWEHAKTYPDVRQLLQRMGTEVGREMFGATFWVDQALAIASRHERVVYTDCRFPSEADAVRHGGGLIIWVSRPGVNALNQHPSESSLNDYPFDHMVVNDGTIDDLAVVADLLVADLSQRTRGHAA